MADNDNEFSFSDYTQKNHQVHKNFENGGLFPVVLNETKDIDKQLTKQANLSHGFNTCKTDASAPNHNTDNDNDDTGDMQATCKIDSVNNPNLLASLQNYTVENTTEYTFLDEGSQTNHNFNNLISSSLHSGDSILDSLKMRKQFGGNTDPTCDEPMPNNSEVF